MAKTNASIQLILMRHGEAGQGGVSDHNRTLTPSGMDDCQTVGRKLAETFTDNIKIICSDAVRTKQTCEQVVKFLPKYEIIYDHDIYLVHDANKFAQYIARHATEADTTILVIGHNPSISTFSSVLTGEHTSFSTANCQILKSTETDWSVALQSPETWQQSRFIAL